jgi:hypothetical protein
VVSKTSANGKERVPLQCRAKKTKRDSHPKSRVFEGEKNEAFKYLGKNHGFLERLESLIACNPLIFEVGSISDRFLGK